MNKHSQRIAKYLMDHPGSSTWEIGVDLHIANVTARMSDLRDAGYEFIKWRDDNNVWRYRIVPPGDMTLGLTA